MKKPYIKKLQEIDGIVFYIVDGKWVRDRLDDQFTNFAIHERFSFIPMNEAWLDKQRDNKEYKYFIDDILAEKKAIAEGKDIWSASNVGCAVEKKERKGSKISDIKLKKLDEYANVEVWEIDGNQVRNRLDISFTEGGHDLVYNWIKPKKGKGEIWMDNESSLKDRPYQQLHEMRERNKMSLGQGYGHGSRVTGAHASASFEEKEARRNPELLKALIEKEKEVARIIYEEGTGKEARKHIDELNKQWNCAIRFGNDSWHKRILKPFFSKHKNKNVQSLGSIK